MLKRNRNALALMFIVIAPGCYASDEPLSSPEKTVFSYCNGSVHDLNSEFFMMNRDKSNDIKPREITWENCKIISTQETNRVGETVERETVAETGDVEVITEVTYKDEEHKPKQFWYLLRKFDQDWKIISYTILDEPEFLEK